MSNDIEEFLRQAAQRRRERRDPEVEIFEHQIDAEVVDEDSSTADVASYVVEQAHGEAERRGLSSQSMSAPDASTSSMYEPYVGGAAGSLESSPRDSGEQGAPPAKGLAAEVRELLQNPQSLRSAILLSEILQRPEHRW